jgi:DNA-binding CsgD family transcriptional regulator
MRGMAELVGRQTELRRLERLARDAEGGLGGALVVTGDAGVGKSALVGAAGEGLQDWLILRARGTEFEQELAYAALQQLCAPVLERRQELPEPQRVALEVVFGLGAGPSPSPLLVGLAVLGLLDEGRPVWCELDDAQWFDAESRRVLTFVARRIAAERVAMLFVVREVPAEYADLPMLALGGLAAGDARRLLGATVEAELADRLIVEANGNPLALELGLSADPLGSAPDALEREFVRRVSALPADVRSIVMLAAAEPLGDLGLLRRAAKVAGLDAASLDRAEDDGLLVRGPRLAFRHPLVRSAAYRSATPQERRDSHAALAVATDASRDPDRRAWHRALAVVDTDEDVAAELAASAGRARGRGGLLAAATFLEKAAELSPGVDQRTDRLLAAAGLLLQAGDAARAGEIVHRRDLSGNVRARLLSAQIDFHRTRNAESTIAMVDAAAEVEVDEARARFLEAAATAVFAMPDPEDQRQLAQRIRTLARVRVPARPVDLLLDAMLDQILLPSEQAVPAMQAAVRAYQQDSSDFWYLDLASMMALDLWDADAMDDLSARHVEIARAEGALTVLPQALRVRAMADLMAGRFGAAEERAEEALAVDAVAGTVSLAYAEQSLAGWRGEEARLAELARLSHERIGRLEDGVYRYASAVLHNGSGDYRAAYDVARTSWDEHRRGVRMVWQTMPELVEAAVRVGNPEDAAEAAEWIGSIARVSATPWMRATHALARAMIDAEPEKLYRQAIDEYATTPVKALHARARLAYGEWLRREGRRAEARGELRAAHDAFVAFGARGYADRSARELLATGETARRTADPEAGESSLTGQERLIAAKVAGGATSKEVAELLFLSPRTIDTHLRNIYRKLGISSRRQLRNRTF